MAVDRALVSLMSRLATVREFPLQTSLHEIHQEFDNSNQSILVFKLSRLEPGETLTDHVNRLVQGPGEVPSPVSETALAYKSPEFMVPPVRERSLEEAGKWLSMTWRHIAVVLKEWRIVLKNLSSGNCAPLQNRGVIFGSEGKSESRGMRYSYYPIVLNEHDGQWWGMLFDYSWMTDQDRLEWSLRDMMTLKHSSSLTSVLACDGGRMLWQNSSSMELYGCHGQQDISSQRSRRVEGSQYNNFLQLLFGPDDGPNSLQAQMRSATAKGGMFRTTVDVGSKPDLRSLIRMEKGQEMHLDCQVTETQDPQTLQKIFIVSQIDVTKAVVAQRSLELAHQKLEASLLALSEEKAKVDALTHEQEDMIECLRWVSEIGKTAGTKARAAQLIDSVKRQMTGVSGVVMEDGSPMNTDDMKGLDKACFLGEGAFGRVFKGKWRDITVAVKTMTLPAQLSAKDRRQTMALMELAISSNLLHENIVKTHSYSIKPIRDQNVSLATSCSLRPSSFSSASAESPLSFQIEIVMEYCDLGNIRDAFGALHLDQSSPNYKAIIDTALDIANGMRHLHRSHIVHADIKPANILLQSSAVVPKGFIAKIADFGLSLSKDDALSGNIAGFRHGTRTHMAPEVLGGNGSLSNASDVYSFGILFFELVTGTQAYSNMSHLNFDEMVVDHYLRPSFPPSTPTKYKDLAAACWDKDPNIRPSFETIVSTLTELRSEEDGETAHVNLVNLDARVDAVRVQGLNDLFAFSSCSKDESQPSSMGWKPPKVTRLPAQHPPQPEPAARELTTDDREFWEKAFNY